MKYLGYTVSSKSMQRDTEKVEAIVNALAPELVQSLQSFIGMVNFYCRFIENLSSLLSPLYVLLGCVRVGLHFWVSDQLFEEAFA